jgi:hypothetical protein
VSQLIFFFDKYIYIYICLDRPWDKSTRAVVDELPDVISPAGLFNEK